MAKNGMAYRLGWGLYWLCVGLALAWITFWVLALTGPKWEEFLTSRQDGTLGLLSFFLLFPSVIAYGLGRFFRYVLSGE
jgi:hypothetical protein